jgi:hypothetical protein
MRHSFLLAAALALAAPGLSGQSLQLADGKVLLATVEDADGDGLRVKRLDNGGVLDLRWDHLSPNSALAVKRQYNLIGEANDEVLTRAEEVEFLAGGRKQSVVGRIVERTGKEIVVQHKGVTSRVPQVDVQNVRTVDVPVTQIYTKDEYYNAQLAEQVKDPTSADQHVQFAELLIKVRDYEHAGDHLQKAKDLANTRDPARLEAMSQRLAKYKEAAKERDLLDQIQAARSRGTMVDFEKGGKLITKFETDFPSSKLKAEFDLEKKRFTEARQRFLSGQVAYYFRGAIQSAAEKKVADESVTLQAARDYAENKMTDDLFARTAQQFKLDVEEVKKLWADRAKYPMGKRTEHFAYNLGSWILGEEGIQKGTSQAKAKEQQGADDPKKDEGSQRDVEKIARALKQALERRRAAAGQGGGQEGQKEQTDEDWWKQAARVEKVGWLRAYYAEFGGQLKVTFASLEPCISCYGEGTTPEMSPEGKMVRTKCFLCHGLKWLRSFKAY